MPSLAARLLKVGCKIFSQICLEEKYARMDLWTGLHSTFNSNETGADDVEDNEPTKFEVIVMLEISTSVCVIGTVSNLLSLTFFFLNWNNKLGEKLLVLLNILDLLVCLSSTLRLGVNEHLNLDLHYPRVGDFLNATSYTSFDCTGFVTSLLTVVRTLATYHPFYEPKQNYIAMAFSAFAVYASSKPFWCVYVSDLNNILLLTTLLLNLVVVLTANFLTIWKLLKSDKVSPSDTVSISIKKNRHASITILILSACFCFLNFLHIVVIFNYVLGHETVSAMFRQSIIRISIPLNSAINPFVYFIRKREMRRFLCKSKCCQLRTRKRNNARDVALSLRNCSPPRYNYSNRLGCPTISTVEMKSDVSAESSKEI